MKKEELMKKLEAIDKAKERLRDMEQDPCAYFEKEAEEAYDAMLNECCVCETCGRGGADALRSKDPIAYRCGFADYMSGETAEQFAKEQDEYKTLAALLETAEDAASELEEALEELADEL
jgi:hypothetical protein